MGGWFSTTQHPHEKRIITICGNVYHDTDNRCNQNLFNEELNAKLYDYYYNLIHDSFDAKKFIDENYRQNSYPGGYIEFACMLPKCGSTYYDYREEINRFNIGDHIDIAYIRHPFTPDHYISLKPVISIIQCALFAHNITYVMHFERIKFNFYEWEEDNAVLKFLFVQSPP